MTNLPQEARKRLFSGECRCSPRFAKPTICPEHGFKTQPVKNPVKPRGQR